MREGQYGGGTVWGGTVWEGTEWGGTVWKGACPGTTETNEFLIRCDGAHLQRT